MLVGMVTLRQVEMDMGNLPGVPSKIIHGAGSHTRAHARAQPQTHTHIHTHTGNEKERSLFSGNAQGCMGNLYMVVLLNLSILGFIV